MKYQSWKWRELKKKKKEWNIIWKTKTEMIWNDINWIVLYWMNWNDCYLWCTLKISFCLSWNWDVFKKIERNKEEWIDIPLIHNTISMSFCVITRRISTFSFLFFRIKNIPQNSPITSGSEDVSFFGFFSGRKMKFSNGYNHLVLTICIIE